MLALTSIVRFNVKVFTIHSSLHIPLVSMHPLEGEPLLHLQEKLYHVKYILIDEINFIGPKLISRIDDHLREVFPSYQNVPFRNQSIILVGDFSQLPLVTDIPMYVSTSHENALWHIFDIVVTLSTIFHQQDTDPLQIAFCQFLMNLRNATQTIIIIQFPLSGFLCTFLCKDTKGIKDLERLYAQIDPPHKVCTNFHLWSNMFKKSSFAV